MMGGPTFLTLSQVNRLHARALAKHGGQEGVREPGLVDSALADPRVPGGGLRPRGPGLAKVRGNRPALLPPGRGGVAHRRCVESQAQDGLGAEDEVQGSHRADG